MLQIYPHDVLWLEVSCLTEQVLTALGLRIVLIEKLLTCTVIRESSFLDIRTAVLIELVLIKESLEVRSSIIQDIRGLPLMKNNLLSALIIFTSQDFFCSLVAG